MNREKFINGIVWVYDYGWEVINPISVVSLGLVKIFYDNLGNWAIPLIILLVVLYFISVYQIVKNRGRISSLEKEIEEFSEEKEEFEKSIIKHREGFVNILKSYLGLVFNKLELSEEERISVYQHQEDHFSLLCRYSTNPEITKKGRPVYPDNQGYIGLGYQKGFLQIEKLPNPETNLDRYVSEILKQCTIEEDVLRNLSMKSRSFAVYAIEQPITNKRVAVVVFESKKYNFNKSVEIGELISDLSKQVVTYLYYSKDITPDFQYAKKEGL